MVERRVIRVLTVYGPGRYFLEDGPRGTVQEYADKLQKVVNEAFKTGLLTVQVAVIPVARDELFPALESGYGDIVMAGTTITESSPRGGRLHQPGQQAAQRTPDYRTQRSATRITRRLGRENGLRALIQQLCREHSRSEP